MDDIILKDFTDIQNYYYYALEPEFAFCSIEKHGKAELLTQFTTCRETVAGELFAKTSGVFNDRRHSFKHRILKIPSNKTCIALRLINGWDAADILYSPSRYHREYKNAMNLDKTFPKTIKASIHILHLIENAYGWEKTVAKIATIKKHNRNMKASGSAKMQAACFYADKKWMRSPHILSLFLLLIRAPFSFASLIKDLNRIKTLEELLEKFKLSKSRNKDMIRLQLVAKYIPLIFNNFEELFGKNTLKNYNPDNYETKGHTNWEYFNNYVSEGITNLCTGKSANKRVAQTFAILSKDPKIVMEAAAKAL